MKMEHVELVWESLEDFEKAGLTFGDLLERFGKALESASICEAKTIGEAARNLEFAIVEGSDHEVVEILEKMKVSFLFHLKGNTH